MKFLSSALLLAASLSTAASENPQGCITGEVVSGKDYFPDKVSATFSKLWSVEYYNTYKIARNLDDGTSYLLYQCGTEPPTGIEANMTLSIPLQDGFAISTTSHLSHFELLGLRDELKAYMGDAQYVSSPCMKERFETGEAINIANPDDVGAIDRLYNATSPEIVLFHNPTYRDANEVKNRVTATAYKEKNNHGIGEWHKYFSVFFNLEAKANDDFNGMVSRYSCTKANAQDVIADGAKPKVLVAYFSQYCGGWRIGSCPNFYCDHIADCSAELVEDDGEGSIVNPEKCFSTRYKTTAELAEFAKDADVWIYPEIGGVTFDMAYEWFKEDLDTMPLVQNKKIYDTSKTARNTWYEHRLVEYDLVLEDVCTIVGASHPLIPHTTAFLRDVFTEETGDLGECVDPSLGFDIRADDCVRLPVLLEDQKGEEEPVKTSTSGSSSVASTMVAALAMAMIVFSM